MSLRNWERFRIWDQLDLAIEWTCGGGEGWEVAGHRERGCWGGVLLSVTPRTLVRAMELWYNIVFHWLSSELCSNWHFISTHPNMVLNNRWFEFLLEGSSLVPFTTLYHASDRVVFLKTNIWFYQSSKTYQMALRICWSRPNPLTLVPKASFTYASTPLYYIYMIGVFCSRATDGPISFIHYGLNYLRDSSHSCPWGRTNSTLSSVIISLEEVFKFPRHN